MKKTKLLLSLAMMCLSVAVLCFGVLAAQSVNYTISGTITYEVTDAFVQVKSKIYKGSNLYNRGELELLSEDLANGTKTLAGESFSQDQTHTINDYDSSNGQNFLLSDVDLALSSENKSYVVEMEISNLSPSVNVWAIAEWKIGENSNVVQGNNVIQNNITNEASKKIYFAVSIDDVTKSITNAEYTMKLNIGVGDYALTSSNLEKLTLTESENYYNATPKSNDISGILAIPDTYNGKAVQIIPSGTTTISEQEVPVSPFKDTNIATLILPDTVQSCYTMCVILCGKVTRIVGVETFTSDVMFFGGTGIYSAKPKNLDGYTYAMCSNLESVDLTSISDIGDYSFTYCENLKAMEIPEGTTSIGNCTFALCKNLLTVHIPASVTSIGNLVLACCESLEYITVDSENRYYTSQYNGQECYCIIRKSDGYLLNGCANTIISNIATGLAQCSFYRNLKIKKIIIPASVKIIVEEAFLDCENLESVTLMGQCDRIYYQSFANCSNLSEFIFYGTIDEWNSMGKDDNWNQNCTSLKKIICNDGEVELE